MQIDTRAIREELADLTVGRYSSRRGSRDARTVPMVLEPTQKQLARMRVGRNDPCPCGSGAKFKKCCYRKQA